MSTDFGTDATYRSQNAKNPSVNYIEEYRRQKENQTSSNLTRQQQLLMNFGPQDPKKANPYMVNNFVEPKKLESSQPMSSENKVV